MAFKIGPDFARLDHSFSSTEGRSYTQVRRRISLVHFAQSFTQRQRGDYNYNSTQLFLEDFSPDNFGERSAGSRHLLRKLLSSLKYPNDTWKSEQIPDAKSGGSLRVHD